MTMNAHILYEIDLYELDREYGDAGVFKVIGELEKNALRGDAKSLHRLIDLFSVSDGYVSEGLSVALAAIFEANPAFVLKNAYGLDGEKRDLLFKAILYENYYGALFENTYPPDFSEIKELGKYSERFVRMYEYYLKHPAHLEDWSVTPPE